MSTSEKPLAGARGSTRRRWRPRFSLRTLVLFVLTVGSGGTFWWNWHGGPWTQAFHVNVEDVREFVFTPDDRYLCAFASRGWVNQTERVTVFDARTGRVQSTWEKQYNSNDGQQRFELSRGGKYLIANHIEIRPLESGPVRNLSVIAGAAVSLVSLSPRDGYALAGIGDRLPERRLLVRLSTFEVVAQIPTEPYDNFEFTSDERWLVRGTRKGIEFYSTACGRVERVLQNPFAPDWFNFAISPDGEYAAFMHENTIRVVDTRNEKEVRKLESPGRDRVSFSPDGKFLLGLGFPTTIFPITLDGAAATENDPIIIKGCEPFWIDPTRFRYFTTAYSPGHKAPTFYRDPAAIDLRTGKIEWRIEGEVEMSQNPWIAWRKRPGTVDLYSLETGEKVWSPPVGGKEEEYRQFHFSNTSYDFISWWVSARDPNSFDGQTSHVTSWQLKHPWQWYGFAMLPEFWMTVVCAGGLVWSVWSKR